MEAVVARPLPDPAGGVRVADVCPVVVPAGDEVVVAVVTELAEQVSGLAQIDGNRLG
jgi:hypothetical protein